MSRIGIIVGSVRPTRIGDQIGQWVHEIARREAADFNFELIELADWPLPMDAEPGLPSDGNYSSPATRAWSVRISALGGFIFVTPQYNWGYPASLKNALDHLSAEWANKPAIIVSYANRGGGRAAAQLRDVLECLRMRVVAKMPALPIKDVSFDRNGRLAAADRDFAACVADMGEAIRVLMSLVTA